MARKVHRFEDLVAWEKAMDLAEAAYRCATRGPLAREFALRDQIQRAAVSVPANIAEGFERGSRAEFHRFLTIAKASCGELRTHLYLAKRLGLIPREEAARRMDEAEEVSRIIAGLRATVAGHKAPAGA